MTAQKLYTVFITAFRSYLGTTVIEENRQGLEKIIATSADLFSLQYLDIFIEGTVQQLAYLLSGSKDTV